MSNTNFPEGWDEKRIQSVLAHYENQTDEEAVAEDTMQTTLSDSLDQQLEKLQAFFQDDSRVLGVWLFGSQADGTANQSSDIDLGILFDSELTLDEQITFQVNISEILGTDDVDILDLRRANLRLRHRAIAGQLLFERDFVRVADFVEETIIESRHFAPRAQAMLRDYLDSLENETSR